MSRVMTLLPTHVSDFHLFFLPVSLLQIYLKLFYVIELELGISFKILHTFFLSWKNKISAGFKPKIE